MRIWTRKSALIKPRTSLRKSDERLSGEQFDEPGLFALAAALRHNRCAPLVVTVINMVSGPGSTTLRFSQLVLRKFEL